MEEGRKLSPFPYSIARAGSKKLQMLRVGLELLFWKAWDFSPCVIGPSRASCG